MTDIPHLGFPLLFRDGTFSVVEQQSDAHLIQQAEVVVRTRPDTLEPQPEFGLRDLTGSIGPIEPEVRGALDTFIPDRRFVLDEDLSRIDERIFQVAIDLNRDAGFAA